MSRYLIDQIARTARIEVRCRTEVRELLGDDALEGLVAEDNRTGELHQLPARALFVFIGAAPAAETGETMRDRRGESKASCPAWEAVPGDWERSHDNAEGIGAAG
jgi:thioredoxin reductase (NADPH)